ncbi:MAG TPA: hypothetical protein VF765_08400 [Polyangiaceae bacterium]
MRGLLSAMTPSRILLALLAYASVSPAHPTSTEHLVIGIQSESLAGLASALHVVIRVDGAIADDETIRPPHGSRVAFPQPWEKPLSMQADAKTSIDVAVEVIGKPDAPPLLTRLASTHFVPGQDTLLRVPLESRCMIFPPLPRGAGSVPGPLSGPTCAPPSTCILGTCQSSAVPAASLEKYAPNWPSNAPDRCKPLGAGAPVAVIGTGQTDYLPLKPGQTLQAEAGPQGGHHIWIATRMKNMKQRLTTTRIEGTDPATGTKIPPSTFVFTYAPAEGGYCKVYGLRYQLDNGGIDYKQFLGKPLDVTVTVTDTSGASATDTAHIQVAPTLVNP